MKPSLFYCSKCNLIGSSSISWGQFFYKKSDVTIPLKRSIGICYGCDKLSSVEVLPNDTYMNILLRSNSTLSKQLICEENQRVEFLKDRNTSARCLDCGSHDFVTFPDDIFTDEKLTSKRPFRTGLIHRKCGGRLYAENYEMNFFMGDNLPIRYFNIEGIEITF